MGQFLGYIPPTMYEQTSCYILLNTLHHQSLQVKHCGGCVRACHCFLICISMTYQVEWFYFFSLIKASNESTLSFFSLFKLAFKIYYTQLIIYYNCVSNSLQPYGQYSPPGSSVHGILQARILEWVAIPFSRGSSQPRDQTWVSCIAGRFFTV